MQNKLEDLNNHLFAQLERLSDEEITDENLDRELKRANAVVNVGKTIVDNAKVELEATKYLYDNGFLTDNSLPAMLEYGKKTN